MVPPCVSISLVFETMFAFRDHHNPWGLGALPAGRCEHDRSELAIVVIFPGFGAPALTGPEPALPAKCHVGNGRVVSGIRRKESRHVCTPALLPVRKGAVKDTP